MYVLCTVQTKNKTERLEKRLIENSRTKYMLNSPQSGGGEGLTEGINYIYIMNVSI